MLELLEPLLVPFVVMACIYGGCFAIFWAGRLMPFRIKPEKDMSGGCFVASSVLVLIMGIVCLIVDGPHPVAAAALLATYALSLFVGFFLAGMRRTGRLALD